MSMKLRLRLVPQWQTFGSEGKVIRHANFDVPFGRHFVRMTVGIDRNSGQFLRGQQFRHACGQAPSALSEASYALLQMLNVFLDLQGAKMFQGVVPNLLVLRGLVSRRPQHPRRLILARMLRHLRGQNFQERMRVRHTRPALESLRGLLVILKLHVVNESQVVIELPIAGIVLNAVFHQLNRAFGLSRPVRRFGSKEGAAKLVGDHEMRIQMSSDFQKRRQQVVAGGVGSMPVSEILDGPSPINAGYQTVVTETGAFDHLGRIEEEHFVERALRTYLVGAMKHDRCGCQR